MSDPVLAAEPRIPLLDMHSFCDRCGAPACVLVVRTANLLEHVEHDADIEGELLFCKHHFEEHDKSLTVKGYEILMDHRGNLT